MNVREQLIAEEGRVHHAYADSATEGWGARLSVIVCRQPRTELALLFRAAEAMRDAAGALGMDVRWCWDWRPLAALPEVIDYRAVPAARDPDAAGFVLLDG